MFLFTPQTHFCQSISPLLTPSRQEVRLPQAHSFPVPPQGRNEPSPPCLVPSRTPDPTLNLIKRFTTLSIPLYSRQKTSRETSNHHPSSQLPRPSTRLPPDPSPPLPSSLSHFLSHTLHHPIHILPVAPLLSRLTQITLSLCLSSPLRGAGARTRVPRDTRHREARGRSTHTTAVLYVVINVGGRLT